MINKENPAPSGKKKKNLSPLKKKLLMERLRLFLDTSDRSHSAIEDVAPKAVLSMTNYITAADLLDQDEMKEILTDIMELLSPYGSVEHVCFSEDASILHVQYSSVGGAETACDALHGKNIGGQLIHTSFRIGTLSKKERHRNASSDQATAGARSFVATSSVAQDNAASRLDTVLVLQDLLTLEDMESYDHEEIQEILHDALVLCGNQSSAPVAWIGKRSISLPDAHTDKVSNQSVCNATPGGVSILQQLIPRSTASTSVLVQFESYGQMSEALSHFSTNIVPDVRFCCSHVDEHWAEKFFLCGDHSNATQNMQLNFPVVSTEEFLSICSTMADTTRRVGLRLPHFVPISQLHDKDEVTEILSDIDSLLTQLPRYSNTVALQQGIGKAKDYEVHFCPSQSSHGPAPSEAAILAGDADVLLMFPSVHNVTKTAKDFQNRTLGLMEFAKDIACMVVSGEPLTADLVIVNFSDSSLSSSVSPSSFTQTNRNDSMLSSHSTWAGAVRKQVGQVGYSWIPNPRVHVLTRIHPPPLLPCHANSSSSSTARKLTKSSCRSTILVELYAPEKFNLSRLESQSIVIQSLKSSVSETPLRLTRLRTLLDVASFPQLHDASNSVDGLYEYVICVGYHSDQKENDVIDTLAHVDGSVVGGKPIRLECLSLQEAHQSIELSDFLQSDGLPSVSRQDRLKYGDQLLCSNISTLVPASSVVSDGTALCASSVTLPSTPIAVSPLSNTVSYSRALSADAPSFSYASNPGHQTSPSEGGNGTLEVGVPTAVTNKKVRSLWRKAIEVLRSKYVEASLAPKQPKHISGSSLVPPSTTVPAHIPIQMATEEMNAIIKEFLRCLLKGQNLDKLSLAAPDNSSEPNVDAIATITAAPSPVHPTAPVRFILGMRQVLSAVKSQRIKLVLIAPDTEASEVLDTKLANIISVAQGLSIPIIYCLNRRQLCKCTGAPTRQSVVAICNYEPIAIGDVDLANEMRCFEQILSFIHMRNVR